MTEPSSLTALADAASAAVPGIGHNNPPSEIDDPGFWYSLISEKAMAIFEDVTVRTLQKWRQTGEGPKFVRLSAKCVKYRRIDGRVHAEARLRSSTSDPGPEASAA